MMLQGPIQDLHGAKGILKIEATKNVISLLITFSNLITKWCNNIPIMNKDGCPSHISYLWAKGFGMLGKVSLATFLCWVVALVWVHSLLLFAFHGDYLSLLQCDSYYELPLLEAIPYPKLIEGVLSHS